MGSDAQILVMIDDLPSTDAAPPENVLFVCRLNAVTRDEDLRVIFAQFGKVTECTVVRDWKTGDSLSYAFVAFERVCDCQRAYTQMENVLIDDRRIHVDFSQSVAHYYWHHQRKGKFTKEKHSQHLRVRHANKQGRSEKRGKEAEAVFTCTKISATLASSTSSSAMVEPVCASMDLRSPTSCGVARLTAIPSLPARAVRPTR